MVSTVPDPELEMGGGVGDGHPNPEKRGGGGGGGGKIFFARRAPTGAGGGGGGVPGPFPWIRHCNNERSNNHGHEDYLRRIL